MSPEFVKTMRPLLDKDEELDLFNQWKEARDSGDDRKADRLFTKIVIQYSPIVKKIVKKMGGYNLDPDELTSEALLALSKAAIDFKPELGYKFSTYAMNCIRGTVYTFVTKNFFITNICTNTKNKKVFFRLRRIMAEQIRTNGYVEMSIELAENLAEQLDVDVDTIFMMNSVIRDPYNSLNKAVGSPDGEESDTTQQDYLASEDPDQDDNLEALQLNALHKQLIGEAMDTLDVRTREIVRDQRLVDDDDRVTLEDLGNRFNISKERARQLREKGLEQIETYVRTELALREFTPSQIFAID